MTDITLDPINSGYNLQKINDNFQTIEAVINDEIVHEVGGNNVMQQDLDMNSNKLLNVPVPEDPTDVVRLIDLGDVLIFDGNIIVKKEEQVLTDGQTTVVFSTEIDADFSVFDIHGVDVDGRRILLLDDYTIGGNNNTVELVDSYPAGTKLVVSQGDIAGGTQVNSIFGRAGNVVAVSGDYSASLVSFDDSSVSFTAVDIQAAIEEVTSLTSDNTADIVTATLNDDIQNSQVVTSYTLTPSDRGKSLYMDNALSNTVNIDTNANQACVVDMVAMVRQKGAGETTVSAVAGVTLNGIDGGSVSLDGQWRSVSLNQYATDSWWIEGMLVGVS